MKNFHQSLILIFGIITCTTPELTPSDFLSLAIDKVYVDLLNLKIVNQHLVSPYGLFTTYAMLLPGAVGNTKAELRNRLHLPDFAENGITSTDMYAILPKMFKYEESHMTDFVSASSMWIQSGIGVNPNYVSILKNTFKTEVNEINFQSGQAENVLKEWLGSKWTGKLRPPSFRGVRNASTFITVNMVFVNLQFGPANDEAQLYNHTSEYYKSRDFIFFQGSYLYKKCSYPEANYEIVQIPCTNNRFGLIAVLADKRTGLEDFKSKLSKELFYDMASMEVTENVVVGIPFGEESVYIAFDDSILPISYNSSEADFSEISQSKDFHLDSVHVMNHLNMVTPGPLRRGVFPGLINPITTKLVAGRHFLILVKDLYTGIIMFSKLVNNEVPKQQQQH